MTARSFFFAAFGLVGQWSDLELTYTTWVSVTAGQRGKALSAALAKAATPRVGEFYLQELAYTAAVCSVGEDESNASRRVQFAGARVHGVCVCDGWRPQHKIQQF